MYIGLMTGTSMDAMDGVLVDDFDRARIPRLIATASQPLPADLRQLLNRLLTQNPEGDPIHALMHADNGIAEVAADVALHLMQAAGIQAPQICAIGSHGQTLRHAPQGAVRYSLQIGNPSLIAERTGITTVADFRRRDMAAGGEGAPLVPAFHAAAFGAADELRTVVNIGGIANVTILPLQGEVLGFDTGPGNTLMDGWAQRHLGEPMDRDGAWATANPVDEALLTVLLEDPYFQRPPPKSTGREHFHMAWLEKRLSRFGNPLDPGRVQATLSELTARTIAAAVHAHAPDTARLLVCGGGAYNVDLMRRLQRCMGQCPVASTAAHGLAPAWVEATAFAWLARQTLTRQPGNLPSVTGARSAVILGGIYPA